MYIYVYIYIHKRVNIHKGRLRADQSTRFCLSPHNVVLYRDGPGYHIYI